MDKAVGEAAGPAAGPVTEREKNVIIAGVLLAMLLAALDQTIVAPAMPTIGAALGHADYLPWIVTAYLLTATAMSPLYGKVSDIFGRRPIIQLAVFIFLAGSVISALAPNMLVLVIGRAVQGFGGGGLFALSQTVIGDLVPPLERARYASWISGMWAVASVAGPVLGGFFAEHLHWSLIFWINLPLGLLALFIIDAPLRKLPIPGRRHSVDGWGAGLLVAATALLLLTLSWGGSRYAWFSFQIALLALGSAVLWAGLAVRLRHAAEPLISLEVLSNRIVLCGTVGMFLVQASSIGLSVFLPVYMQSWLGLTASESGFALLCLLLGMVAGASTCGTLIPRFRHYKRIALSGVALAVIGLFSLAAAAATHSLVAVELLTIAIGFGTGTAFPVMTVSVQNAVDRAHLGVATGVLSFLRSLGGALGVAVLGAVALTYGLPLASEGTAAAPIAVPVEAFAALFALSGLLMVAAFLVLWKMPEKPLRSS